MRREISIITICFNNLDELIKTCKSVDFQNEPPYEHLIIDGSKNVEIKKYLESNLQPNYRKWICEPDNGIADAFNKGVKNCDGDIIQFLNSADCFYNENALKKVNEAFNKSKNITWLHGKQYLKRGGEWVIIGKTFESKKLYRGMRSVFHQTMFVNKSLFEKYGLFDTSLKIAMDYDFVLRLKNEPFYFLPEILVSFDPGGISNTNYLESLEEIKKCYNKRYGKSYKLIAWQWRLKVLNFLLQSKIGIILFNIKRKLNLENF